MNTLTIGFLITMALSIVFLLYVHRHKIAKILAELGASAGYALRH